MPKTGTTSLQNALSEEKDFLLSHGILYPSTNIHRFNHNFFGYMSENEQYIPPSQQISFHGRINHLNSALEKNWKLIERQIKKHNPHTTIISAETIFKGLTVGEYKKLRDRLMSVSTSILPVVYVRQPSRHYLSNIQQKLKYSNHLYTPPQPFEIRNILESCEKQFGQEPKVIQFEKQLLFNEDITSDFLNRFTKIPLAEFSRISSYKLNQSVSAESMEILQSYSTALHTQKDNQPITDNRRLHRLLYKIERQHDLYRPPQLKPRIAEYIDYSSVELLWLRDKFNIIFQEIDYSAIKEYPSNSYAKLDKISDICDIDQSVKQEISKLFNKSVSGARQRLPGIVSNWAMRNSGSWIIKRLKSLKA